MIKVIENWTVQGYYPNHPMFGFDLQKGITQFSATEEYLIEEGDCLYDTLYKNGLIENPMLDVNSYKCEWVANRWWVYRTQINVKGNNPRIVFSGVDGEFSVFINNVFKVRHANSYVPLEVDLSEYNNQNISILVMVENQKGDLNQSGYTSKITTQRPRYNTKWDFCPRIVSLGLVAPVYLNTDAEISECKIVAEECGKVSVEYQGKYFTGDEKVYFTIDGKTLSSDKSSGVFYAEIENANLWYPNGLKQSTLYKGVLSIESNGVKVWEKQYNVGFRTIQLIKNEKSTDNALPYTFVVNGEKVYIKGVNFVPVDMCRTGYHKKYEKLILLAKEMNVNLIRVWGGGTIETEEFYNLCDENGIMVWQDFMQSSSGIDNCATVLSEGMKNIKETAEYAVKNIRNHPSLAVYCGGNELMDNWVPLTYEHANIAMLKSIIEKLDGNRFFFPTTASGPTGSGNLNNVGKGVHHDIHGPWTYQGNEEQYLFYNNIDSLFHSEFGVDGFCNPETLPLILSEKYQKVDEISKNYVLRHKAEWWDPMPILHEMFGEFESLEELCLLSQYLQAEGLRYAIEANRRRAYNNSGCIIWQFNEPYPNLCCTNIVDYFGKPKLAYYAVKQAYAKVNPNLKHDKTYYQTGEVFQAEVFLTSDIIGKFDYTVEVETNNGKNHYFFVAEIAEKDKSVCVGKIEFVVPSSGAIRIKLVAEKEAENYSNERLLLIKSGEYCDKKSVLEFVKGYKS